MSEVVVAKKKSNRKSAQTKNKALRFYAEGVSPSRIANDLKVNVATVHRWAKASGIVYGAAIPEKPKEINEIIKTGTEEEFSQAQDDLKKKADNALLAANSAAEAYNNYMAETMSRSIRQATDCLPAIKNWADMERANKIMRQALGLDSGNSKNSAGGKISIDLNVIALKPTVTQSTVIDVVADD